MVPAGQQREQAVESLGDKEIYHFEKQAYFKSIDHRPWREDVKCFTKVKVSAIAMLKMVLHAIGGGSIEVMVVRQR